MPTTQEHSSSRQYQSSSTGAVITVPLSRTRKVTYVFEPKVAKSLRIPHAVAIDGVVQPEYVQKAHRVKVEGGEITVAAAPGEQVSLFLNSDAQPAWRKQPVYAVTVGNRDVVVTITEKGGKNFDTDTPILTKHADPKVEAAKTADTYSACLTGDIWMKVSHKYTPAEVQLRLPAGTSAVVEAAVTSIYQGLSSARLTISEPGTAGTPSRTLAVGFSDSSNPHENINNNYALLTDGLPRVHPAGYAALFTAALENNITAITLSSCWRPMLGSIVHRIGLGLDVSVLGATVLNRQELRRAFSGNAPSRHGNHDDEDNVTDAEVTAFGEYEDAIKVKKAAEKAREQATVALDKANLQATQFRIKDAEAKLATANTVVGDTSTDMNEKEKAWDHTRNVGEPAHARLFRASLLKCTCVGQLFDPWYMSSNTHSGKTVSNKQLSELEKLHAHHLHITIDDPKIL